MENVFLVLFLACFGALILGLINPRWVFMRSRVKAFIVFFFAGLITMAVFGNMVEQSERRAMAAGGFTKEGDTTGGTGGDTAAAEPSLGRFVLRADTSTVTLSSERDLWDRAHVIAEFPSGTEVDLLERVTAKGRQRCRVRTNFQPRVAGWVMCENLQ